jgi:hypothetical protein
MPGQMWFDSNSECSMTHASGQQIDRQADEGPAYEIYNRKNDRCTSKETPSPLLVLLVVVVSRRLTRYPQCRLVRRRHGIEQLLMHKRYHVRIARTIRRLKRPTCHHKVPLVVRDDRGRGGTFWTLPPGYGQYHLFVAGKVMVRTFTTQDLSNNRAHG